MTDLRKAAEMALEALEDVFDLEKKDVAAIQALRQALAQPEQEYVIDCPRCGHCCPERKWVGLTRAERFEIEKSMSKYYDYQHQCKTVCLPEFANAIEAKLKEKNT